MRVTNAIIILCVFFFIFQLLFGLEFTYVGVLVPGLLLDEPWRIFTSMFLHADPEHLFFNMFALFMFGNALERRVGSALFTLIYLISGIVGAVGFMMFSGPEGVALGASGAIFGIIGALAVVAPGMVVYLFGGIPMPMYAVGIFYALIELFAFGSPDNIAHSAHLLGLIGGFVVAEKYRRNNELGAMTTISTGKALIISIVLGLVVAVLSGAYYTL